MKPMNKAMRLVKDGLDYWGTDGYRIEAGPGHYLMQFEEDSKHIAERIIKALSELEATEARVVELQARIKRHEEADEGWERGPYKSMCRALELLGAGPFDNVDHAAERVMSEMLELRAALVDACAWIDANAPGCDCWQAAPCARCKAYALLAPTEAKK
jgi:hypothetical protein